MKKLALERATTFAEQYGRREQILSHQRMKAAVLADCGMAEYENLDSITSESRAQRCSNMLSFKNMSRSQSKK